MPFPRLVIAGLSGGAGKTQISLGLARAFTRQNIVIRPFKKGPDYIDTAWLAAAAKGRAFNLDPYFLSASGVVSLFAKRFPGADVALIEGNRGYFDGLDIEGTSSTATLAQYLAAPVILVLDCTKMTRTAAALVAGCKNFPGGERIVGVILNKVARKRHADVARRSIEELSGTAVLGVIPRMETPPILERRTGLVCVDEHPDVENILEHLADIIADNVDLNRLLALARSAPQLPRCSESTAQKNEAALSTVSSTIASLPYSPVKQRTMPGPARLPDIVSIRPRIGVVKDAVLWEYYADNLEALEDAGAELIPLKLMRSGAEYLPWPPLHGVYLGGGDLGPYAAGLAADAERRLEVHALALSGMPVYAEHAGFFYLAQSLEIDGQRYPMAGVFPFEATVQASPQGLGYVDAESLADTPFSARGEYLRGHEYHYISLKAREPIPHAARRIVRSTFGSPIDGFCKEGCQGFFMQLFAPAVPGWAFRFVDAARRFAAAGGGGRK